jgi:flagellar P-ring protein FlgI
MRLVCFLCKLLLVAIVMAAKIPAASRIKELVSLEGVRDNQLVGYGIVVGLSGTGDRQQTVFSIQSLTNVLQRMGVTVPPAAIIVHNTAAVLVTATLPPFSQPGGKIDADVAAIGDATNLQGGLLVLTPLRAANGQVFAMAQGSVITGGFLAGRGGNSQTVNHPTVGRVVEGAIVEQSPPSITPADMLHLQLRRPDFSTASRISSAINQHFNAGTARAVNSGLIAIRVPETYAGRSVEFIAALDELEVDADRTAKISINERTGTVVFGGDLRIAPVAILQGNLSVQIQTTYGVSQPNALSSGRPQ